ncbi:MAG: ferritin-like domain-containing protein [Candidatus Dormiibacterota bacterium]
MPDNAKPQAPSAAEATSSLLQSFTDRRSLLKSGLLAGGVAGGMAVGGSALIDRITAAAQGSDTAQTIFSVARTAEQLAVTFYSHALQNYLYLGLLGPQYDYIAAALIEEQIHLNFFVANGGQSLASTFSFPHGPETFWNREYFFETQQQLENSFDSAFIAAVREFAEMGQPSLSQIACQVAMVEAEHRVLGRVIVGAEPPDNHVFAPATIPTVGAAPGILQQAGYLSPTAGNSYAYAAIDPTRFGWLNNSITDRTPSSTS